MKKICIVVLLVLSSLIFASCNQEWKFTKPENVNLNYNNISSESNFWVDNGAVYFFETGIASTPAFRYDENGKTRIDSFGKLEFVMDDMAYFSDTTDAGATKLYRKKMPDGKKEEIGIFQYVEDFFVLDGYLFYEEIESNEYLSGDDDICKKTLNMLSLNGNSSERIKIADLVVSSGVADENLMYIRQEGDGLRVYSYDISNAKSNYIGEMPHIQDDYSYWDVSYTSGKIVFANQNSDSSVYVFNFRTGKLAEYGNFKFVYSVIAYEEYAYVMDVDFNDETETETEIFRLSLSDGSCKKITVCEGRPDIFVTSDNDMYMYMDDIYHFDASGEKTTILQTE